MGIAVPNRPEKRVERKKLRLVILCPRCGNAIDVLPVQPGRLSCSACGITYEIEEFEGFRYPVLMDKREGRT